ncbi:hypothetical protein K435DRAFT_869511 [Dendrothele bispora CBS 962.96]|uniref:C2H2-type domain-containing protein n=1 Tax=Dendrothele bispora (strain CBS 962.96) TaxID=1314807 RepID=A0A4S8L911_DENBC|nr:hypothetical protein K435DRAFT_869511 [Dendrothele bispora CBS 962.96]
MTGTTCQGCGQRFSDNGYSKHISTSTNPACQNLHGRIDHTYAPPSSGSLFKRLYGRPQETDTLAIDPTQDYFGSHLEMEIDEAPSFPLNDDGISSPRAQLAANLISHLIHAGGEGEGEWFREVSDEESSDVDELEIAAERAEMENCWEPDLPNSFGDDSCSSRSPSPDAMTSLDDETFDAPSPEALLSGDELEDDTPKLSACHQAEKSLQNAPYIKFFPDPHTGAPIPGPSSRPENEVYLQKLCSTQWTSDENTWAPFKSEMDWRIVKWAKLRGPSSTALTELLSIPNLVEKLDLSFKSANELNKIIDMSLPARPAFKVKSVIVHGEAFEVYFRDVLDCIKTLYSEPDFAPYMKYAPERHDIDERCQSCMFHNIHTGEWWWWRQKALDKQKKGGTIIPLIFSMDKTLVTNFRGESAYPLYLTLGNILKECHRVSSLTPILCAMWLSYHIFYYV